MESAATGYELARKCCEFLADETDEVKLCSDLMQFSKCSKSNETQYVKFYERLILQLLSKISDVSKCKILRRQGKPGCYESYVNYDDYDKFANTLELELEFKLGKSCMCGKSCLNDVFPFWIDIKKHTNHTFVQSFKTPPQIACLNKALEDCSNLFEFVSKVVDKFTDVRFVKFFAKKLQESLWLAFDNTQTGNFVLDGNHYLANCSLGAKKMLTIIAVETIFKYHAHSTEHTSFLPSHIPMIDIYNHFEFEYLTINAHWLMNAMCFLFLTACKSTYPWISTSEISTPQITDREKHAEDVAAWHI